MELNTNHIRGYLGTLKNEIYGAEFSVPSIFMKKIGYDQRATIFENTDVEGWQPFENGSRWGGKDVHTCFNLDLTITKEMENKDIWMQVRTGATDIWNTDNPQFLIYINGKIVCGMDMNHHEVCVSSKGCAGEHIKIGVYAYSNSDAISDYFKVSFLEKHREVEKLYYDVKVPFEAALEHKPEDLIHINIMKLLTEVTHRTYLYKVPSEEFYQSVEATDEYLRTEFYEKLTGKADVTVHSIGHTHIDVAWKWPVRQTREKVLRSFATVLNYMEDYPAYRFMSSQPQLYQFVKEEEPELFERIKQRVLEGRWETEGAMWLEADCNLTSGESLVRQILKGNEFFKKEFGTGECKVLWLPDVFGYSAALPQILKKSGIDYFMTTKINWNERNKMPHDCMMWRGIDGTEILTYFISTTNHNAYPELKLNPRAETTYNGRQNVSQIKGTWQRFSDKDLTDEVLTCYGYGDGGGGPTREMLEEDSRMSLGIPGVPVTRQTFTREFFDILKSKLNGKKLPKWDGELYLEYHRGTYTSMAKNKKNNRCSEYANEQTEWMSTFAQTINSEFEYPVKELDKIWKLTLLNQFHDILPGSSIEEVYDKTDEEYKWILEEDARLTKKAAETIIGESGENIAIFNPLPFERDALVETSEGLQLITNIPAKGYKVVGPENVNKKTPFIYSKDKHEITTPFVKARFNKYGEIESLYDLTENRQVNRVNETFNHLIAFEDRPWEYDCWNIDSYYEEKSIDITDLDSFEVTEDNGERFTIHIKRSFLNSIIEQWISFYSFSKRIDFKTSIDWKEQQILLKTAFPVDVLTNKCVCDIQFGNVERPTHTNTSWDEARFEICAQKWVDVSENGYGMAVMSDCKYGYDVKESVVRLTLLKSGIFPNPNADKGHHEFVYSILPHTGDFREGQVVQEASKLNQPVLVYKTALPAGTMDSLLSVDAENVLADTVKLAEDGDGYIIRVHETYGKRTKFKLDVSRFGDVTVCETDLLEKNLDKEVELRDGVVYTSIKPYEILTFRIR